jgi:hypothetical protein
MLLLLWNVDIFVFPAAPIPLLVVGYFCHGIANPLHFTKSYMHRQSSVTVSPHDPLDTESFLITVAVCADGAIRVFRIDDTSSKSFK